MADTKIRVYAVPRPFSLNGAYRNRQAGGRVKSREYAQWKFQCMQALMSQHARRNGIKGAFKILIVMTTRNISPRFDTDNAVKGYLDALKGAGAIEDDKRTLQRALGVEWHDEEGNFLMLRPVAPESRDLADIQEEFYR